MLRIFFSEENVTKHWLLKIFSAFIFGFFFIFFGCAAKSTKQMLADKGRICSFETLPSDKAIGDFDWETHGYVSLTQFKKYATKGKFSAQAAFSVPADFLGTTQAAKVDSWIAGMTMGIDTLSKLKITDWSAYKKFGVDIYVPDDKTRDFYIKFTDENGKEHIALRPLKKGRNKLDVPLADIQKSRINTSGIVSFSFYLDTKEEEENVILYLDNVRLIP